ncbi:CLUMA_CG005849, isoform A [Clunio marinus]|uniref:CLUMA_CG005849, isoform A n=1 Tax=Clunio marinus TaxID=568069 RepID=A0A1J1HYB6_9DIPT|nr:CLUMA_CG005849, isoform A [Clunio marinus]
MKFIVIIISLVIKESLSFHHEDETCMNLEECRDNNLNITLDMLEGIWFLAASIDDSTEDVSKCSYYNVLDGGKPNSLKTDGYQFEINGGALREFTFFSTYNSKGDFLYIFPFSNLHYSSTVIAIDEDIWIMLTCPICATSDDIGIRGMIMTRGQFPESHVVEKYKEAYGKCGLLDTDWKLHNQNNCNFC